MNRAAGAAVLLIACAVCCAAQPRPLNDPRPVLTRFQSPPIAHLFADTGAAREAAPPASKSPALAMLLSALLPGAGQFYNESYWKVPVVAGLGGYFIAEWLSNNRKASDYRDRYAAGLAEGFVDADLLTLREFYKDQRDAFAWYFVILYAANILDAYVDASLYDFDVSPELGSLSHLPGSPTVAAVCFSFRF